MNVQSQQQNPQNQPPANKLERWKKNAWKIAGGASAGLLVIKFVLWPLFQKVQEVSGKWIEYWPYAMGILAFVLLLVIFGRKKNGKSADFKKLFEPLQALAKLAATGAFAAILVIFLTSPRTLFQGWYLSPHNVAIPQPQAGAQAAPVVRTAPVVPPDRTVAVPAGDLNTPTAKWSEEVQVIPGWSFRWDMVGQDGRMAVLVDGREALIREPLTRLDVHPLQSLRFLSLEGQPLTIHIAYYR